MGNQHEVTRVACVAENCGTFPMDEARVRHLKQTGDTFVCPAGHKQHFTESPESKLRERIGELERQVEREKKRAKGYKDRASDLWDMCREEKASRDRAEQALLDRSTGVVRFAEDSHKWACACGANGMKGFETADDARQAWKDHRRREGCGDSMPDDVIPVADA